MKGTEPALEVVIAEDSAPVRSRLVAWIEEQPGVRVVAAVSTGPEAVDAWRALSPHVMVLDLGLPGFGGLEVLRRIRLEDRETVVLVLTNHDEPSVREAVLRADANGFYAKATAFEQLIETIASLAPARIEL